MGPRANARALKSGVDVANRSRRSEVQRKGVTQIPGPEGPPLLALLDEDDPTDVGGTRLVRCVPCRGTGQLVTRFSMGPISHRPCVACGGKGRAYLQPATR
jgi:hypothetical protein